MLQKIDKSIGGEFWYDNNIISKQSRPFDGYFLSGGRSSLSCICRYLKLTGKNRIMLPSYLCPTILDVFDNEKIDYIFYDINEDFSINIDSIKKNLHIVESIMIINYFGLSLSNEEISCLISLKNSNKVLIEDKVHTIYKQYFGDFAFNSFRKFLPVSGSILQTDIDMENIICGLKSNTSYDTQIKKARDLKTEYIVNNKGTKQSYLRAFELAESLYYEEISCGNPFEKIRLEQTDFDEIGRIRNQNYRYLQTLLGDIKNITIIFKDIGTKTPLGLPIYIDEDKRDILLTGIKNFQIYLPVHWNLKNEERIHNNIAKSMSDKIVTLVIDQRYGKSDMDMLASKIKMILG